MGYKRTVILIGCSLILLGIQIGWLSFMSRMGSEIVDSLRETLGDPSFGPELPERFTLKFWELALFFLFRDYQGRIIFFIGIGILFLIWLSYKISDLRISIAILIIPALLTGLLWWQLDNFLYSNIPPMLRSTVKEVSSDSVGHEYETQPIADEMPGREANQKPNKK